MQTYLSDIFNRVQRFSKKLDHTSMLLNKHWVLLDELSSTKVVYIFQSNNVLIISQNGVAERAKWEYLSENSIIIDFKNGSSYLYKHGFLDSNILALKIDSQEKYAVLVNENKFQDQLNSLGAITLFLEQTYLLNPPEKGIEFNLIRESLTWKMGYSKEFNVSVNGKNVTTVYQRTSDGKYYIHTDTEIILFEDKSSYLSYIHDQMI